jgi:hypothetical protein
MAIRVACGCGKQADVSDQWAGKKIKCPRCKKLIVVPAPDSFTLVEESPAVPESRGVPAGFAPMEGPGQHGRRGIPIGGGPNPIVLLGLAAVVLFVVCYAFSWLFGGKSGPAPGTAGRESGASQRQARVTNPDGFDVRSKQQWDAQPNAVLAAQGDGKIKPLEDEWRAALELQERGAFIGLPTKDLHVVSVMLVGNAHTDKNLETLRRLPHLVRLDMAEAGTGSITDRGIAHVATLTNLEWLDLTGFIISDDAAAQLAKLSRLRVLLLDGTRMTDQSLAHLSKLQSLEALSIVGTKVTADGLRHISGLTRLEELGLYDPKEISFRRDLGELPDSRIDPVKALPHLASLTRLTNANMLMPGLSPKDFEATDTPWPVPYTPSGQQFDDLAKRWRNRPSGANLVHLKGMTGFKTLDLRGFFCRDEDLVHLAGLTNLETLSLSGSPITAAGLRKLKSLQNLKHLNLRATNIRDADLAALADFPALTDVTTTQSLVTEEGVKKAEGQHPRLVIKHETERDPASSINPNSRPDYMEGGRVQPSRITNPNRAPIFGDDGKQKGGGS